jgi:sensor histidine kinase regulating citrate/malate metabolism
LQHSNGEKNKTYLVIIIGKNDCLMEVEEDHLGLSLAYDIVKALGGEIKVNTREGEFMKFVVQLPITA